MNQDTISLHLPWRHGKLELEADLTDARTSPHTGRPLRQAEAQIEVAADVMADFQAAVDDSSATDDDGNAWRGRIASQSYSNDDGPHWVSMEWEETEDLHPDVVSFEGLNLRPLAYEEESDSDGVVTITLQAALSADETTRLREVEAGAIFDGRTYWSVVRTGISDEPRMMRFGKVTWSLAEDGGTVYSVVLVDEAYDANPSGLRGFSEPELTNTMRAVAITVGRLDRLLDALERGDQLSLSAVRAIREGTGADWRDKYHQFFQVEDASE